MTNPISTIKHWYKKAYPNDEEGDYINADVTFMDLFNALDWRKDVYSLLGVSDSVIRERCFKKLAEIMKVDYNYIYEQWLLGA